MFLLLKICLPKLFMASCFLGDVQHGGTIVPRKRNWGVSRSKLRVGHFQPEPVS